MIPMEVRLYTLEITRCKACPNREAGPSRSIDGWDRGNDWMCGAANDRIIQFFVEWHEIDKIEPPNWCPLPKAKKEDSNEEK